MTVDVRWAAEVEAYLDDLARGDRTGAFGRVRRLRDDGHEVMTLIRELLAPAQLRVGELWMADTWSVAQEHAATAISEAVLATLTLEADERRPPPGAPSVIVTCVEQEWHALPALMVAEHLRAEGFAVSYLGANSSAPGLVRHVHDVAPRAVLLSCSLSTHLPLLRRQLEAVRETGTPVMVGGSAFDAGGYRAEVLGASAFATSATGVGALVRRLPEAVPPAPPLTHPGAEEAYIVFGDREELGEEMGRAVAQGHGAEGVGGSAGAWLEVLDDQLPHVVGSVAGALVSDDPSLVSLSLTWAEQVLVHRGAPPGVRALLRTSLAAALQELPVASRMVAAA